MAVGSTTISTPLDQDAPASGRGRRVDRAFWIVSLIIALSDVLFIYVNHVGAHEVLYENLAAKGQRQEVSFALNLRTESLHMQQVAALVAGRSDVRELFLAGRQAVEAEGGGRGGERAAVLRQALFDLVAPSWLQITRDYQVRQLHFHLGPGDTSFLRVHRPHKFGDDLSPIRHTITHAIRNNQPTQGFESGRVYAGIRGVVPIVANGSAAGEPHVVGALEAGSSFARMLELLSAETDSSYSVLLTRDYFYGTHWPDSAARLVAKRPLIGDWFVEGSPNDALLRALLADSRVLDRLGEREPVISRVNGIDYAVFSFPFRDFLRDINSDQAPIGNVVVWHDATAALAAANSSLRTNLALGVLAFLVVESLLFTAWMLARRSLQRVIDTKTQALSETNQALTHEISRRVQSERELKDAHAQLEVQVAERTRSLTDSVGALRAEMAQRRSAETALQQERDQAQVTLRSIVDGVVTCDTGGRVVYMNPAAEQLTGWPRDEAQGLPLEQVFPARDLENDGSLLAFGACLEGRCGRQHGENTELRQRNGRRVTVEHSVSPIRNESGAMIGLVLVFHDDTEARQLAVELSFQASHDSLTGLINRRAIEMELAEAVRASRSNDAVHAFLYIDLDQFKVVNDTCGHVAGDELLRQLAKLLQHKSRHSDSLARLGGDEFGLLLRDCPVNKSSEIAEELLETLRGFRFVWEKRTFRVGASIGVAIIDAESESVESILSAADAACYLAKEKGRSRVHLSLPDDGELELRRGEMQWVNRIQQALVEDRLVLFGQPIVAVQAGQAGPPHEEILVRMLDEQGELIPPTAFIPAAERYGIMPDVDRWIIDRTCRMISQAASRWPDEPPGVYSVNLSGETMASDGILDFIRGRFVCHRIDPRRICFEVTETAAIANMASAIDLMTALKQDGCRFALDDFGSGLSSFGYLKALPVDYLKIDGAFVKNLDTSHVDYVMVKAINEVGHAMQLKTIAEFVENDTIFAELRDLGIDYAQGYGIGQPVELPALRLVKN